MKKTSKIIFILSIVLAIVLGLTIKSKAETEIQQIDPVPLVGNNTSNGATAGENGTNENKNGINSINASKNNTTNINSSKNITKANVNQNLPSTGIEDYTPLFIIVGGLVVVAIVAYKKAEYYKKV